MKASYIFNFFFDNSFLPFIELLIIDVSNDGGIALFDKDLPHMYKNIFSH